MTDPVPEDEGVTLIEMVVAMMLTSIFMTIFTTGVLQVFGVVDRSDSVSIVQSQLNTVFLRLDKEIRYAAGITAPGSVTGGGYTNTYVEYLSGQRCGQLRLHVATGAATGQLQERTWPVSGSPGATWSTLATGVSGSPPFTFLPADATSNFQRLRLTLSASSGTGRTAASRRTDVTFTAVNSQITANGAPADPSGCVQGRS
jgi:prepilin-type N-terminal cleavage/methylation domain-containing protein